MKTFLITGSSGFIGSNLVRTLIQKKGNFHLLVNKNSNLWRLNDILPYVKLHKFTISDDTKIKSLIKKIEPDYTFHLASYGVYPIQNNFNDMIKTNIIGTFNLFKSLERYSESSKIVNIGSSFEYGSKHTPIKKSELLTPENLYGISKSTQSLLANFFSQKTKLNINTLRIFQAYGRYESKSRLIPTILLSILKQKKILINSPKSKRDFIHIDDIVSCIISVSKKKINHEIINVGSGKEHSIEEIIEICRKIIDEKISVLYNTKNQQRSNKTNVKLLAEIKETTKLLDWKPKISLREGLLDSYVWFKNHQSLYD